MTLGSPEFGRLRRGGKTSMVGEGSFPLPDEDGAWELLGTARITLS